MTDSLTQITWCIGTMREGDTRSTIRTDKEALGCHVEAFAQALEKVDLVMDVTTWGDTVHAKLDIGDRNSRILPWADQPTPRDLDEWNRSFQRVEDAAEVVVRTAHQLLVNMVPAIHFEPIVVHDWTPWAPQPTNPNHAYAY